MWRGRRRIQRLEAEVAAARADQTELRHRLAAFEAIAAAAGASQGWWAAAVPSAPMPASLLAAANEQPVHEVPVRVDVAGTDVIAVIGGPGDPREWWSAVWQLARPAGGAA